MLHLLLWLIVDDMFNVGLTLALSVVCMLSCKRLQCEFQHYQKRRVTLARQNVISMAHSFPRAAKSHVSQTECDQYGPQFSTGCKISSWAAEFALCREIL